MLKETASVRRIGLALGLVCIFASAANAADPQPKSERGKMDEQVFGQLTKAWTSFYDGKNEDAVKQAEPLLKLSDRRYRWVAVEAAHLQARAYWAHGGRRGQAKAQQLWKQLERIDTSNVTKLRLKIAQALELEAAADDVKRNQAIALLEQILKDRQMNLATPEAGIDLARLYVQSRRFDDAEKTLKFVIDLLGDKRTLIRMELPDEAVVQPYIKAAKGALARLKYERDAGREEFEAAEKLRKQEKWLLAARAYQAITKDFAETDYAPRSELHIGDCLLGLGRESQAVAHWKKFIEPLPAGPWRAQAYTKIIDYCLEEQLDLPEAGKYAALARSSLPTALADEKAGESWQAAAFDVQLRVGLVSFCEGSLNKAAVAAEAFDAAKQLTSNKTTAERLDALIAAAKSGKGVIPEDCRASGSRGHGVAAGEAGPSDKAALALSMGVIHLVAGRLDNAEAFFYRVGGDPTSKDVRSRRPMPGATPAQMAFATFGRGAVLQAHRKESEAKEQFLASLKAFGDGSWHDETLYRVATITKDLASAKFAKAPEPASPSAKPLTAKQREAAAKAEEERLAALLKAKGEALPYWQGLITRYPKSPRCEQAMYNAGVLLCELAEVAPAAQAEKAWKEVAFMFNRFCELYPKSPLAGDAYVRQVDVALERMFDLDLGRQLTAAGVAWAKGGDDLTVAARDAAVPPEAWRVGTVATLSDADRDGTLRELYRRAGVVAYLDRKYSEAVRLFRTSDRYAPVKDGRFAASGRIATGAERVVEMAQQKRALTPDGALDGSPKVALILQLADIYHATEDYRKSIDLCDLVVESPSGPTREQKSWALFKRGRNRYCLGPKERDAASASADYQAAVQAWPQAPWAHSAVLLSANIAFNVERDTDRAVEQWRRVLKEYPDCSQAHRCAYYIGVAYEVAKRPKEAKRAYQEFLERCPDSPFVRLVHSVHLKRVEAMERSASARHGS